MKDPSEVLFGLRFFRGNKNEACAAILSLLPKGGRVFTPNAEMTYRALKSKGFHTVLEKADLLLPDGAGVVLGARMQKKRLRRLPGVEVAEELLQSGTPAFLLGGASGVAEAAKERIVSRHPAAKIVGTHNGYFAESEAKLLLSAIRKSGARLLFVGLGSPRQEEWIERHKEALGGLVVMGVGGSLDIYAGKSRRAPRLMQRMGLEWLYRLVREPRRIWRMRALPLFFFCCLFRR